MLDFYYTLNRTKTNRERLISSTISILPVNKKAVEQGLYFILILPVMVN